MAEDSTKVTLRMSVRYWNSRTVEMPRHIEKVYYQILRSISYLLQMNMELENAGS